MLRLVRSWGRSVPSPFRRAARWAWLICFWRTVWAGLGEYDWRAQPMLLPDPHIRGAQCCWVLDRYRFTILTPAEFDRRNARGEFVGAVPSSLVQRHIACQEGTLLIATAFSAWGLAVALRVVKPRRLRARWLIWIGLAALFAYLALFNLLHDAGGLKGWSTITPPASWWSPFALRQAVYNLPSALLIYSLWGILVLPAVTLRTKRSDALHCAHCGYNLTGNKSGTCPECGQAVPTVAHRVQRGGL